MKYNGRNITVTEANKIEYIHLMADYKINKQVYIDMTDAFKKSCLHVHVLNMKISKSKIQSTGIFHFLWSYLLFCGHILGWIWKISKFWRYVNWQTMVLTTQSILSVLKINIWFCGYTHQWNPLTLT